MLVFNNSEFTLANLYGWRYGSSFFPFVSIPGFMVDLRVVQPLYGPGFTGKCMFGIDKLTYTGNDAFEYKIGFTPVYNTLLTFT